MRHLSLLFCLLLIPIARVSAQSPAPRIPVVVVSPGAGDGAASRQGLAQNLPADVPVHSVLFDPTGGETASDLRTTASGTLAVSLIPPVASWQVGLYRWVVALANGVAYSAVFAVTDGSAHLYVRPDLPSPNSAFEFAGVGFGPNLAVHLHVLLTGGQGQTDVSFITDLNGNFFGYLWPQQLGFPFFAAGDYRATAPDLGLSADFRVREHPVSELATMEQAVNGRGLANVNLQHYPQSQYMWGIIADMTGHVRSEYLLGPSDIRGAVVASLPLPSLPVGRYLFATPYNWGETDFTVAVAATAVTPSITPTPVAAPQPGVVRFKSTYGCHLAMQLRAGRCVRRAFWVRTLNS